jgi:hypothetical protein
VTDEFLGYDRVRVIELRTRVRAAVDFFDGISSDEPCAAGTIATIRGIGRRLSTEWMPYLTTLVGDPSMRDWPSTGPPHPPGTARRGGTTAVATFDPSVPSDADLALAEIANHFRALDTDGDGELSWAEIAAGAFSDDAELSAACRFLVDHPLAFVNTALADANYSVGDVDDLSIDNLEDGGWEFDMDGDLALWQYMTLTPATIITAQTQNRHQRTLARPDVFAAADGVDDEGEIDGRVSRDGLAALAEQTSDPDVIAMCEYFAEHPDAFKRIDRESPDTGFDGTIAYDQLFALGLHQGALIGLPDPTIPNALRDLYGDPVDPLDPGDGDTQFIHYPIEPQPGQGQVVIVLYIPTPTAGVTPVEGAPVLGDLLVSEGNGRGPDPAAHPSDSKLHLVVDYETGIATVRIPPSVGLDGGVSDALPIVTDMGAGGIWLGRLTPAGDSNHVNVAVDESGSIEMNVAILNADKRVVAPWVNGRYVISPADGGRVQLFWMRDPFPAMEAYHVYPDGEIVTLADDDADWGAVVGLVSDVDDSGGVSVG